MVEVCPVHHRIFSNIPGLYPPDASGTPPVVTTALVSSHRQMSLGSKITVREHLSDPSSLSLFIHQISCLPSLNCFLICETELVILTVGL